MENGKEIYSHSTYKSLGLKKVFVDVEGLTNLSNIICEDGQLTLNSGTSEGGFECLAASFAGNVSYIDLVTAEKCPEGTSIRYEVSVDGGQTWETAVPVSTDGGKTVTEGNRKYFEQTAQGNQVTVSYTHLDVYKRQRE